MEHSVIVIIVVSLFKEIKILYLRNHDCRLIMDPELWLNCPWNLVHPDLMMVNSEAGGDDVD